MFWLIVLAATVQQAVMVVDSLPTGAELMVYEDTVHLIANGTKSVYFSGSIMDANGCVELLNPSFWQIKAYRTGLTEGFACTPNGNNCYLVDPTSLVFSDCADSGDSTLSYTGQVDLRYFADATDADSNFPDDDWTLELQFKQSEQTQPVVASDHFIVASLIALKYHPTIVDYGHVALGADSAIQTITFTSVGNRAVDLLQTVSGDFVCAETGSANLPLDQLKYHLMDPDFAWDDSSANVVLPVARLNLNLLAQQSDAQVNTQSVYYRLRMPLANETVSYLGRCTNTLALTAVIDDNHNE